MADFTLLRARTDNLLATRSGGLHPPAEVLAAWPRPNYVNPEERGWEAPIVLMVMLFLTMVVFMARIWARLVVSKNAGIDDVFMSISMLPTIGLTVACILGTRCPFPLLDKCSSGLGIKIYGFQWHVWDQTPKTLVTSRQVVGSLLQDIIMES